MYHAFALLTPKSDATASAVAANIKAKFPSFQVNEAASTIDLLEGDWDYHLAFQSGPQIEVHANFGPQGARKGDPGIQDGALVAACPES